jgi:hypothetical protein
MSFDFDDLAIVPAALKDWLRGHFDIDDLPDGAARKLVKNVRPCSWKGGGRMTNEKRPRDFLRR